MEIAQAQSVLGLEILDSPEQAEKVMIFSGLRKLMRKLIDVEETQLMETLNTKKSRSKGYFSIKGSYHI
jgi:hypothetical protein